MSSLDRLGDVALIVAVAQAPRTLRARPRGTHRADERSGVSKPQVSSLHRVRVSGKYSTENARVDGLGIHAFLACESPSLAATEESRDPHPARAAGADDGRPCLICG
ncbi:MAG: hypothetical protein M3460_17420 [Actinomycetota bacterium]|nr:hypothetical protein [Actinomycetota bacterium]